MHSVVSLLLNVLMRWKRTHPAVVFCRVLRPGGRFLCLEFSKVVVPGMQQLYDLYSFNVIPQIGR